MSTYARSLRYLPQTAGRNDDFSITQFIESLDTRESPKPFIFVTSREREHAALAPLITAWVDSAVAAILSLAPSSSRRIWCVLDEIASLQRIPSLETLMSEGRKYGAAVIAGTQAISRLHSVYGKNEAETLLSLFNTYAIYRANDPTSTEWAVRKLGESEMERASEYLRYDPQKQDRMDLARQRGMSKLVIDSELTTLPDLECYLKVAGAWPLCRTKVPYQTRIMSRQSAQAFIEADITKSVYYAMKSEPDLATEADDPGRPEDGKPRDADSVDGDAKTTDPARPEDESLFVWATKQTPAEPEPPRDPAMGEWGFETGPRKAKSEDRRDSEWTGLIAPSVKSKQPSGWYDFGRGTSSGPEGSTP